MPRTRTLRLTRTLSAFLLAHWTACTVQSSDANDERSKSGAGGAAGSTTNDTAGTAGVLAGDAAGAAGAEGPSAAGAGGSSGAGNLGGSAGAAGPGGNAGAAQAGTAGSAPACSGLTEQGRCDGDVLEYCEDGISTSLDCAVAGQTCGVEAGRAECMDTVRAVACAELTHLGACDQAFLRYCDPALDVARSINCAAYGQTCDPTAATDGGASCVSYGTCGSVDEDGTCNGNELRFCEGGELYVFDCGLDECGVVAGFADCFVAAFDDGCGQETAEGRCSAGVLTRCLGNMVTQEDCEVLGLECIESAQGASCERGACPAACPSGYSCTQGVCSPDRVPDRDWTVAVYMVGDNNLSDALWQDLNELEEVGSSARVQVVAEVEFSSTFAVQAPAAFRTGAYRMVVERDEDVARSASLENAIHLGDAVNMGSSAGLTSFLRWTSENYPAKRVALILSNHGLGYQGGFYDTGEESMMSLRELVAGVRDSGVHVDLLGMDACMMGMHEVGMAFRGVADAMVASQEVEPGSGYPYADVLSALSASPTMSAAELGNVIVEDYTAGFSSGPRERSVTMATFDLRALPAVNEQLASFAETVLRDAPGTRSGIRDAVSSEELIRSKTPDIADIGSILDVFAGLGGPIGNAASDARSSFNASGAVLSARGTGTKENTSGLGIYFPELAWSQYGAGTYGSYWSGTSFLPMQTWRAMVSNLSSSEQEVVTPGEGAVDWFSVVLSWGDEPGSSVSAADLDLYVYEPSGDYGTPANGSTTASGLFSADSYDSEVTVESYELRPEHETGTYLVLVSLYDIPDGERAFPRLQVYRNDLPGGSRTLVRGKVVERELLEIPMDASQLLTEMISAENLQGVLELEYSNIWYATTIEVE